VSEYGLMVRRLNESNSKVGNPLVCGIQDFRVVMYRSWFAKLLAKFGIKRRCVWCKRLLDYPAVKVWSGEFNTVQWGWVCLDLAACEGYRYARLESKVEALARHARLINVDLEGVKSI